MNTQPTTSIIRTHWCAIFEVVVLFCEFFSELCFESLKIGLKLVQNRAVISIYFIIFIKEKVIKLCQADSPRSCPSGI